MTRTVVVVRSRCDVSFQPCGNRFHRCSLTLHDDGHHHQCQKAPQANKGQGGKGNACTHSIFFFFLFFFFSPWYIFIQARANKGTYFLTYFNLCFGLYNTSKHKKGVVCPPYCVETIKHTNKQKKSPPRAKNSQNFLLFIFQKKKTFYI